MSLKINFYCDKKYKELVPEPIQSSKQFPKWFSDLPFDNRKFKLSIDPNDPYRLVDKQALNVKKCLGISEFLNTGYIIPSWTDFIFREREDGNLHVNWVDNFYPNTYHSHTNEQYETMPNKPIYGHFGKICTPWIIKTDPGVSCLLTHPIWHRNKNFTTTTAIIHTDIAPFFVNWFFEWNFKMSNENWQIDIKNQIVAKNDPIILIIPFYRKKYSSKINYISNEEWDRMLKVQRHLTHDSHVNETQCPYKNIRKTFGRLFQ